MVQQQTHFDGNVLGNKYCRCNGGSLYHYSKKCITDMISIMSILPFCKVLKNLIKLLFEQGQIHHENIPI